MDSSETRMQASELPLTTAGGFDTPTSCPPGCFACANGDPHPSLHTPPTPMHEFLDVMKTCKRLLILGYGKNGSTIKAIKKDHPDLESGHKELEQLETTRAFFKEFLDCLDDTVFHAKRVDWYKEFEAEREEAEETAEAMRLAAEFEDGGKC